jgi:hypothetical protein
MTQTEIPAEALAEPSAAWRPTHVHADGGLYRFLRHCDGRADNHEPWLTGALYEGADGRLWWTGNDRWFDRFAPLSSAHSAADGGDGVPVHSSPAPADLISSLQAAEARATALEQRLALAVEGLERIRDQPDTADRFGNRWIDWAKAVAKRSLWLISEHSVREVHSKLTESEKP